MAAPRLSSVSLVVIIAAIDWAHAPARAQSPPAPLPPAEEQGASDAAEPGLGLDEIVVTATSRDRTAMRSSLSVTNLTPAEITAFSPRSEAEVFRNIPGIRAESTGGPGGNSNIAVRGLPISTGGAKFLQIQEDGLPVVQFGDIAFGNNDIWTRFDYNVARIEAIRGGSASTFVSNAPGGVINYISKTGEDEGGAVGLSAGLDYDELRLDFDYGGPVTDTLRFHLGGYYRNGEGPREAGFDAVDGYQVKANVTQSFADDAGYIRLYFKRLDDRAPTYSALPMRATVRGNRVGDYEPVPGLDAREESSLSRFIQQILSVGADNQPIVGNVTDGVHAIATAVGIEIDYELSDRLQLEERFRYDDQEGVFFLQRLPAASAASVIRGVGGPGATARFANGPFAGQLLTPENTVNDLLSNSGLFFTEIPSLRSYANDLSLTGRLDLLGGELTARAGYYRGGQRVNTVWHSAAYVQEVRGDDAAFVDIFNAAGVKLTENGQLGYNLGPRNYDLDYTINAGYASLGLQRGPLNLDASMRYDHLEAGGTFTGALPGPRTLDVNGDGAISAPERNVFLFNNSNPQPVDYTVDYWSWSAGANYLITPDVAVFARASRGGRANSDRLIPGPTVSPVTGELVPAFADAAVDFVEQQEAGAKVRLGGGWGDLDIFATLFHAELTENNFDLILQRTIDQSYEAYGAELEAYYAIGGFSIRANATYTDAEITRDDLNNNAGNVPRGQPEWLYSFTPQYSRDWLTAGFNVIGQSEAWTGDNNGLLGDGYAYVNTFLYLRPIDRVQVGLLVNNIFDTFGQAGRLNQTTPAQVVNGIVVNRPELGRTVTATLAYQF